MAPPLPHKELTISLSVGSGIELRLLNKYACCLLDKVVKIKLKGNLIPKFKKLEYKIETYIDKQWRKKIRCWKWNYIM